MDTLDGRLKRLKSFLCKLPSAFCVVFRVSPTEGSPEMAWCTAFVDSSVALSNDYKTLAKKYLEVALDSYRHDRDLVLKESMHERQNP